MTQKIIVIVHLGNHNMQHIVTIANQKGGVGKTTTAINLSASLAALEKKILLIDLDPQGNATSGLGVEVDAEKNVYKALFEPEKAQSMIIETKLPYLSLLGANQDLIGAEIELVDKIGREFYLRDLIKGISKKFDFIIIDCPPSLGLLTVNALCAGSKLLIPLQCEYYALEGIAHLLRTYNLVKNRLNPELDILGVVLTMFDKRNNLSHQVAEEVKKYFNELVFNTIIPRNVRLSEAPSHGLPVILYDVKSKGARAYMELAKEFIKRFRIA